MESMSSVTVTREFYDSGNITSSIRQYEEAEYKDILGKPLHWIRKESENMAAKKHSASKRASKKDKKKPVAETKSTTAQKSVTETGKSSNIVESAIGNTTDAIISSLDNLKADKDSQPLKHKTAAEKLAERALEREKANASTEPKVLSDATNTDKTIKSDETIINADSTDMFAESDLEVAVNKEVPNNIISPDTIAVETSDFSDTTDSVHNNTEETEEAQSKNIAKNQTEFNLTDFLRKVPTLDKLSKGFDILIRYKFFISHEENNGAAVYSEMLTAIDRIMSTKLIKFVGRHYDVYQRSLSEVNKLLSEDNKDNPQLKSIIDKMQLCMR